MDSDGLPGGGPLLEEIFNLITLDVLYIQHYGFKGCVLCAGLHLGGGGGEISTLQNWMLLTTCICIPPPPPQNIFRRAFAPLGDFPKRTPGVCVGGEVVWTSKDS